MGLRNLVRSAERRDQLSDLAVIVDQEECNKGQNAQRVREAIIGRQEALKRVKTIIRATGSTVTDAYRHPVTFLTAQDTVSAPISLGRIPSERHLQPENSFGFAKVFYVRSPYRSGCKETAQHMQRLEIEQPDAMINEFLAGMGIRYYSGAKDGSDLTERFKEADYEVYDPLDYELKLLDGPVDKLAAMGQNHPGIYDMRIETFNTLITSLDNIAAKAGVTIS